MNNNNLIINFKPYFKVHRDVLDDEAMDVLKYNFGNKRTLKDYEIANRALRINAVYMEFYFNETKDIQKKII